MQDTFILLIIGHLLGDFALQSDAMVRHKRRPSVLGLHVLVVAAATWLALGGLPIVVLLLIGLTHGAIDWVKVNRLPDRPWAFVVDQGLHLLVIVALAWVWPTTAAAGWLGSMSHEAEAVFRSATAYLGGFVLAVPTGAAVVGVFVSPLTVQLNQQHLQGLEHGGKYIGWLERALIFLLAIMQMPQGIGFLFAAKSIFRFNDLKDPGQRKFAEYVIIGTFLSFGWALLASHLTLRLLATWGP